MRNLLLALATGALLIGTVPASAQIYGGVDPYGAGMITVGVVANIMPSAPTVRW